MPKPKRAYRYAVSRDTITGAVELNLYGRTQTLKLSRDEAMQLAGLLTGPARNVETVAEQHLENTRPLRRPNRSRPLRAA